MLEGPTVVVAGAGAGACYGDLLKKKAGGGLGGRAQRLPPNAFVARNV